MSDDKIKAYVDGLATQAIESLSADLDNERRKWEEATPEERQAMERENMLEAFRAVESGETYKGIDRDACYHERNGEMATQGKQAWIEIGTNCVAKATVEFARGLQGEPVRLVYAAQWMARMAASYSYALGKIELEALKSAWDGAYLLVAEESMVCESCHCEVEEGEEFCKTCASPSEVKP